MTHSHGADAGHAGRRKWGRATVLGLTALFLVTEVGGGLVNGSLALLADAGHMLSDVLSLGLALFAVWLADRPVTPNKSFGYKRAEILAALFNGVTLVAISIWIFAEAYRRIEEPPEILGWWMLVVAMFGLLINVAGAGILSRSGGESLNVQGALRHVIADVLGSLGAILAAGIIILEQTPRGIDAGEVGGRMAGAEGVEEVHGLHIWTIPSGFPALSAHVLVGRDENCHVRRRDLEELLAREYGIEHTTLQVDHVGDHVVEEPRLQSLSPRRKLGRRGG